MTSLTCLNTHLTLCAVALRMQRSRWLHTQSPGDAQTHYLRGWSQGLHYWMRFRNISPIYKHAHKPHSSSHLPKWIFSSLLATPWSTAVCQGPGRCFYFMSNRFPLRRLSFSPLVSCETWTSLLSVTKCWQGVGGLSLCSNKIMGTWVCIHSSARCCTSRPSWQRIAAILILQRKWPSWVGHVLTWLMQRTKWNDGNRRQNCILFMLQTNISLFSGELLTYSSWTDLQLTSQVAGIYPRPNHGPYPGSQFFPQRKKLTVT